MTEKQLAAIEKLKAIKLGTFNHPAPEKSAMEGRNIRMIGFYVSEEDAGLSEALFLLREALAIDW